MYLTSLVIFRNANGDQTKMRYNSQWTEQKKLNMSVYWHYQVLTKMWIIFNSHTLLTECQLIQSSGKLFDNVLCSWALLILYSKNFTFRDIWKKTCTCASKDIAKKIGSIWIHNNFKQESFLKFINTTLDKWLLVYHKTIW